MCVCVQVYTHLSDSKGTRCLHCAVARLTLPNCAASSSQRRSFCGHRGSKNLRKMKKITVSSWSFLCLCISYRKDIVCLETALSALCPPPSCQSLMCHSLSQIYESFRTGLAAKLTYAKWLSACDCQLYHPCLSPLPFPRHAISSWVTVHFILNAIPSPCNVWNFSVNRMLPGPSETDKDICVPRASSIIQSCWASSPDSSELVYTLGAELLKGSINLSHLYANPQTESQVITDTHSQGQSDTWRPLRDVSKVSGTWALTVFLHVDAVTLDGLAVLKVSLWSHAQKTRAEFSTNNMSYIVLAEYVLKSSIHVLLKKGTLPNSTISYESMGAFSFKLPHSTLGLHSLVAIS